jgi:cytochrome c-type biogenesis protein CcmH
MHRLPLLLLALLPTMLPAIDTAEPIVDPQQRELYERLTDEVRCLVCQNQTIADSNAPLAMDLRREIRVKVEAGQSEAEIKTFLTDRYGDFVLYRPRFDGPALLLWLTPALLLLAGAAWLWRIVLRRAELPITSDEEDAPEAPGP